MHSERTIVVVVLQIEKKKIFMIFINVVLFLVFSTKTIDP